MLQARIHPKFKTLNLFKPLDPDSDITPNCTSSHLKEGWEELEGFCLFVFSPPSAPTQSRCPVAVAVAISGQGRCHTCMPGGLAGRMIRTTHANTPWSRNLLAWAGPRCSPGRRESFCACLCLPCVAHATSQANLEKLRPTLLRLADQREEEAQIRFDLTFLVRQSHKLSVPPCLPACQPALLETLKNGLETGCADGAKMPTQPAFRSPAP